MEFDGEKIHVSPNLVLVFHFLSQIEQEVTSILEINSKLFEINRGYSDLLKIIKDLVIRLEKYEPEIKKEKFKIPSGNSLNVIAEKFTQQPMIRSQMIVLMSSLEVLFALDIAYKNKTSNEKTIQKYMMNYEKAIAFLNSYVFNKKNVHFKFKEEKLSKIKSQDFRKLRNSLVHFFSLPDNFIVNFTESEEEENINNMLASKGESGALFLSVRDLEKLVKTRNSSKLIY